MNALERTNTKVTQQPPSRSPLLLNRRSNLDLLRVSLFRRIDMNEHTQNAVETAKEESSKDDIINTTEAQIFPFQELANATDNFSPKRLIGVGCYGNIYKGTVKETGHPNSRDQIVVVERLDEGGSRGNREFLVEVLMLNILKHPNLVKLVGYCAEGDKRLLVHEYMPMGSLDHYMHDTTMENKPLEWHTRMKIALGVARGLDYLHHKANPSVIYRNMKLSNILLDIDFNAKLSDFGLAKLGPIGDKAYVSTKVIGTKGYIAPEYEETSRLTVKADVYSFGVVLLELITRRRVIDITRPTEEQNLVEYVMKNKKKPAELADQHLQGDFPATGFNQALAVAVACLQEDAKARPEMSDIVTTLMQLYSEDNNNNSNLIQNCIECDHVTG